jgi:hypothetical protein
MSMTPSPGLIGAGDVPRILAGQLAIYEEKRLSL